MFGESGIELNLPESLKKIHQCILGTFDFKEIYIPKNVEYICSEAFCDCDYLENFNVSDENMCFSSYNGILCNKDKTELVLYPHARKKAEFVIPEGISKIGNKAFDKDLVSNYCYTNKFLRKVVIPGTVDTIGEAAFKGLGSLKILEMHNGVKTIEKDAFKNCAKLEEVYIPESIEKLLISVFTGCKSLKKIYVSDKLANEKVLENIGKTATKFNAEIIKCDLESLRHKQEGKPIAETAQPKPQPQPQSAPATPTVQKNVPSGTSSVPPLKAEPAEQPKKSGCYVATAVYGSYDCPEVWTLRRFRDYSLATTLLGRLFIMLYYAISPALVKWFGNTKWFKKIWKAILDKMVEKLQMNGFENTPYQDRNY